MQYRLLLVDDDKASLAATKTYLENQNFLVDSVESGEEGIAFVKKNPEGYALVVLDYQMKAKNGAETAQELIKINPDIFVLINSGDFSAETVRATFKAGAIDFRDKGEPVESFLQTIKSFCSKYEETTRTISSVASTSEKEKIIQSAGMIGRSDETFDVARKILRYSTLKQTVLTTGDTGTGKELVALQLHDKSKGRFIAVNCAAFASTELLESELFGYERGAFTGANARKIGLFELARGGLIFLDEIHHLGVKGQAKLLRALDDKKIRRVGGHEEIPIDVRIVVGAKPEIHEMATRGEVLLDFYYRIKVLQIPLKPLRERIADIEPLVAFFTQKHNQETGQSKRFLAKTVRYLEQYEWPGNVRELKAQVESLLMTGESDKIEPQHLDPKIFGSKIDNSRAEMSYTEFTKNQEKQERSYFESLLKSTGNNRLEASKKANVSRSTLYEKLGKLGIKIPAGS